MTFSTKNILTLQLMTPYNHFHNTTERAIGIIKDHFIAGLESLDPTFPMRLCCHLAPQAVQILNLMLDSRINPHFSSETQINGALDFKKTPLATPGTKVLIHERPEQQQTWAHHGIEGFYVG